MLIGVFDPYLDDLGGGEKYMLTLASCLSKNHEVELFWDKPEDLGIVTQRFSLDISRVKIVENVFSGNFSLINRLRASRKYDAIIVLSDGSIPLVWSKKLFLHIQQPIIGLNYSIKSLIKLSRVSGVFCNSEFTQSFLHKSLKNKSIIIYPPIDLKPKQITKENIILTVGRFRVKNAGVADYKKQSVLVDIFKKMIDKSSTKLVLDKGLKGWKFVLATSVKPNEEAEFEKLKVKSKNYPIEFLVNKTNDELWDIYSKAKIYWHATGFGENLEQHPDFAEHFGISTVEAMGSGVVPVVINAGGQKEIIEQGTDGYLWENEDDLIEKTLQLVRNPKLLERMGKEAESKAKKFAERDFCKDVTNLITNA